LIAAILVGSSMKAPPIWCHLIGPTSGGKSTFLEAFGKVDFVTQVSDLTVNTFLSGMGTTNGETSLLLKLGPTFTIFMKDFTTIISKSEETQQFIIAQMREIYDGHITKDTGTGKRIEWPGNGVKGHATFVMAVTEAVFSMQDKFSDMGTRAINYVLKPQHRKDSTRRSMRSNGRRESDMNKIQDAYATFVSEYKATLPEELPYINEELENDIVDVGDFSSLCRSVIKRDYRGVKSLALSAEMPMRMANQLLMIAQLLAHVNNGVLEPYLREAIFKTALDSIPKQRRLILEVLAKYTRVNVAGVSDKINYPPERCKEWMEDLQMFGVIYRIKTGMKQQWAIKEEYRKIMINHLGVVPVDNVLEAEDDMGGVDADAGNYGDMPLTDIDVSFEHKEEIAESAATADSQMNSLLAEMKNVDDEPKI